VEAAQWREPPLLLLPGRHGVIRRWSYWSVCHGVTCRARAACWLWRVVPLARSWR